MKKTEKMLEVEKEIGRTLETALPELLRKYGQTEFAKRYGVNKATLTYWMLKLGFRTELVILGHDEEVKIIKK